MWIHVRLSLFFFSPAGDPLPSSSAVPYTKICKEQTGPFVLSESVFRGHHNSSLVHSRENYPLELVFKITLNTGF